jgi:SAM-dependent methyltransferase
VTPPGGSRFDALVEDYDAARPGYPAALLARLGLAAGARVVEVGAGTGLATRLLRAGGAEVLALDPGPAMLGRLRRNLADVPVVQAVAEALPVRAGAADAVCAAQCWHWFDGAAAAAEAVRVLRPGGLLALWWNSVAADGAPWWDWQQDRLEELNPGWSRHYRARDYAAELDATGLLGPVVHHQLTWTRTLDVAGYLRWLQSKSYVADLGPQRRDGFLTEAAAVMSAAFPDALVTEPLRVDLYLARSPGG